MARVKCGLCPTECVLGDYEIGGCKVRINRGVGHQMHLLEDMAVPEHVRTGGMA